MRVWEIVLRLVLQAAVGAVSAWAGPVSLTLVREDMPFSGTNDIYIGQMASMKATIDFTNAFKQLTISGPGNIASVPVEHTVITIQCPKYPTALALGRVKYSFIGDIHTSAFEIAKEIDPQIIIDYEVVCVSLGGHKEGSQDSTQIDLSYSFFNGSYTNVVPVNFSLRGRKDGLYPQEKLQVENVTEIQPLNPLTFGVNLTLPSPSTDLEFSVMSDAYEVLVQEIRADDVGDGFRYAVDPIEIQTVGYDPCPLNTSLSLKLENLINKASLNQNAVDEDHQIYLRVTLLVTKSDNVGYSLPVQIKARVNNRHLHHNVELLLLENNETFYYEKTIDIVTPNVTHVRAGEMSFLLLRINTPVLSHEFYGIDMYVKPLSSDQSTNGFSIMSVVSVDYGANLRCQDINHSLSVYGYDELDPNIDRAIRFHILNIGIHSDLSANYLYLRVVVSLKETSLPGSKYTLIVVTDSHVLPTTFITDTNRTTDVESVDTYAESVDTDVESVDISNSCPTQDYHSDSLVGFLITIVTRHNATAGPVTIAVPSNTSYNVHSASLLSKGRNIACGENGTLDYYSRDGLTIIDLGWLCNNGKVNSSAEDDVVIEISVTLTPTQSPNASDHRTEEIFQAEINVSTEFSHLRNFTFYIRPSKDLLIPKLIMAFELHDVDVDGILEWRLLWSNDDTKFYLFKSVATPKQTVGSMLHVDLLKPRFARYIRVINAKGRCLMPFDVIVSDDVPLILGPREKSWKLTLRFMESAIDWSTNTCMSLPLKTETETTPYVWAELSQSLFGREVLVPFHVVLRGHGLECESTPSQVTMVVFPKPDPTARSVENPHQKCDLKKEAKSMSSGKNTCTYHCACANEKECGKFTLLLKNMDNAEPYNLCDVSVKPVKSP